MTTEQNTQQFHQVGASQEFPNEIDDAALSENTGPAPLRQLTPHPHSTLFPMMSAVEQVELEADITEHGQHEPIVLFEGQILDGRNRYRACVKVGIEPKTVEFEGDDPIAFVLSANLHRRHLTQAQKQSVIAKLLAAEPARSDRAIGRIAHVDGKTVGAIRSELETRAEIPHAETREDTKGRLYPAHRAKRVGSSPPWSASRPKATPQAASASAISPVLSDPGDIERHLTDLLHKLLKTLRDEKELIAALPKMQRETMAGLFAGEFLALLDIPIDDLDEMVIRPAFVAALLSANLDALLNGEARGEP